MPVMQALTEDAKVDLGRMDRTEVMEDSAEGLNVQLVGSKEIGEWGFVGGRK